MTSSQIPSRIAMPCPFGGFGTTNITTIQTVQGNDVNFKDGFPDIYGAPTGNNGRFVTRKEMNAIGNLASNDLFYHKCGGLNTFDADFCAQIGGYPYGAVLEYLIGNQLYSVMSLKDNNKVDFTGTTPTSSQSSAGIVAGLVDGVNWVFCNKEMPTQQTITVMTGDSSKINLGQMNEGYLAGIFTAPANGVITGSIDLSYGDSEDSSVVNCYSNSYSSNTQFFLASGGLFVKDVTDSLSGIELTPQTINTWSCVSMAKQNGRMYTNGTGALSAGNISLITPSAISAGPNPPADKYPAFGSIQVSQGRKYAVATVASRLVEKKNNSYMNFINGSYLGTTIRYNGFQLMLSVV